MRKFLLILLVFIFSVSVYFNFRTEEIRVRVIPNSDSSIDLKVKSNVKDMTICYLKRAYSDNYEEYKDNIYSTVDLFEESLRKEFNKEINVSFDYHTLYNKTYNNSAVKNSKALTLYIVIENGSGSNWWGTVYPDFLEINSSEEIKYESLILNIFKKIGDNDD